MKGRDHRRDPKSLSDGELVRICAATPRENRLEQAGCLGSLAALMLLFPLELAGLFKPALIGFALAIASALWALHLAGRRGVSTVKSWLGGAAPPFPDIWKKPRWNSCEPARTG